MPRISDVVLVGPRLAIAVSATAARWSAELAAGSYRLATELLGNGSAAEGAEAPAETGKTESKKAAPRKRTRTKSRATASGTRTRSKAASGARSGRRTRRRTTESKGQRPKRTRERSAARGKTKASTAAKSEDKAVEMSATPPTEDQPEVPEVNPNVPQAVGGGFPETPGTDPGDRSEDPEPHHALNTPVGEPDPTEWPDPYEEREDPRDPPDPDDAPFGEEAHPASGSKSTSEPHPDADIEAPDANPPQRDKLDE
jgi:hypothetical protein